MKKTACLLLVGLFLVVGSALASNKSHNRSLRYDGLYVSRLFEFSDHTKCWLYLRFYSDGTVIGFGSDYPPELEAGRSKADDAILIGKFTIKGNRLSFSTVLTTETVDYVGTIDGDQISLNRYSHIENYKKNIIYTFIKVQPGPISTPDTPYPPAEPWR
jgi:hypothetical protein